MTSMMLVDTSVWIDYFNGHISPETCLLYTSAIREPSLSIAADEAATLDQVAGEELAAGINENNPSLVDYLDGLSGAGLRLLRATTPDLVDLSDDALAKHGRCVGAVSYTHLILPTGPASSNSSRRRGGLC